MGLFGALFAGVSGLNSQSNKIGIISNNISNVNTVGYKQGQAAFDTLVVPSGSSTFSPGGVIGQTQQLVSQQGLIQATTSPTDISITGGGFFVVNTQPDNSGNTLLTRAGSFTQDASGNFINANGFFLQGIPITNPPTSINATNLQTVNVNQSATGTASATTLASIAANLNAAQVVLPGSGEIATLKNDAANSQNTASQIIAPTGATGNNLMRGDSFSVTSVNASHTSTYTYGGFSQGRDITATLTGSAASSSGDGNTTLDTNESIAAGSIDTNVVAGHEDEITINGLTNGADYVAGQYANISGVTTAPTGSGLTAAEINGEWQIVSSTGTSVTVRISTNATAAVAGTGSSGLTVTNRTQAFTGNILNATAAGGDFLSGVTSLASVFTTGGLQFQIQTTGSGGGVTSTFTYSAQPDPTQGQFNSLNSLVNAINASSNGTLTARTVNGRLFVSATDANQGLTFSNVDAAGNDLPTASGGLAGIDWVQELDLPTTALADINAAAATNTNRFNTLAGLADKVNSADTTNLIADVKNPAGISTVSINEADPTSQVTFADTATNTGASLLLELGFVGPNGASLDPLTNTGGGISKTTTLPITYSAGSINTDMSSGAVIPQFTKDITIFDSLGNAHTIAMNFAKISVNKWAVELTSVPATDIVSPIGLADGQIASGILNFNGDGTLQSVVGQTGVNDSIQQTVTINWTQTGPHAIGASPSKISFNLGTPSESDGLTQSAAPFNVSTVTQNGSPIGQLTGVTIDTNGFVIETFSNGQTQKVFQIPIANVSNPNGLEGVSGNAYQQTLASGQVNLNAAGQGGTGTITPSALEQSNVDLSTQLTNLIVAQQAYGANSKVLTIADQLLQQLDQIIQ